MRVLYCYHSRPEYMRPLDVSDDQVVCGPFVKDSWRDGRPSGIRTPAGAYDIGDVLDRLPADWRPDLFLTKTDAGRLNMPRNLGRLDCPKVLISGDTQHMDDPIRGMVDYALSEPFDIVLVEFIRRHAHYYREAGLKRVFFLPCININPPAAPLSPPETFERPLGFFGAVGHWHPYRTRVLRRLRAAGHRLVVDGGSQEEALRFYNRTQVNLNLSHHGDLNMRHFEILAAGGFMLCNRLSRWAGERECFGDGPAYATFDDAADLAETLAWFLDHPDDCRAIARAGGEAFWARHTPDLKRRAIVDIVFNDRPPEECRIDSDPRTVRRPFEADLVNRIAVYQVLQDLDAEANRLTVVSSLPPEARLMEDLDDLPRLRHQPLSVLASRPPSAPGEVTVAVLSAPDMTEIPPDGAPDLRQADHVLLWDLPSAAARAWEDHLTAMGAARHPALETLFRFAAPKQDQAPADAEPPVSTAAPLDAPFHLVFWPDYSAANPYQALLAAALERRNWAAQGGDLDLAIQMNREARKQGRPVVFHLHWIAPLLRGPGEPARAIAAFLDRLATFVAEGGMVLWTVHNALSHDRARPAEEVALRRRLGEIATAIHVHSDSALAQIERHYPLPRDKVIVGRHPSYIGAYRDTVARDDARRHFGLRDDQVLFLFLGQIRPYKGLDALLPAFATLNAEHPSSRLLVAGRPDPGDATADLLARCQALPGLGLHADYVPDDALQVFYAAADYAVLPYTNILTSGAAVAALSFGCPIIAPDLPAFSDLIEDGVGGILYPSAAADGPLVAMRRALLQTPQARHIQRAIAKDAIRPFDWDSLAGLIDRAVRPVPTRPAAATTP